MKFSEIVSRLTGLSTPVFGVSWQPKEAEVDAARRIVTFLEDRRVLYNPSEMEIPEHCVRSVLEIRRYLTDELGRLHGYGLEDSVRALRAACRKFLDAVNGGPDVVAFGAHRGHWANWAFNGAVGELRGVFGVHVAAIAARHGLDVEDGLASILPGADEGTTSAPRGTRGPRTPEPKQARLPRRHDPIAEARERYRPNPVQLVFVAEAPPASDSDRFFYFTDVRSGDALFLNVMRAVYLDVRALGAEDVPLIRAHKAELLEAFKRDGYYLIDASDEPMPDNADKREVLARALPSLQVKVAELSDGGRVPFILITKTVFDACRDQLEHDRINVLNTEPIPFPRQQWLEPFRERIGRLLTGELAPRHSGIFR